MRRCRLRDLLAVPDGNYRPVFSLFGIRLCDGTTHTQILDSQDTAQVAYTPAPTATGTTGPQHRALLPVVLRMGGGGAPRRCPPACR